MSNRSRRAADSRAEARRRSRQLEREYEPREDEGDEAPAEGARSPAPGGSLLRRLFPSAPPLPNKPDPLAGFDYQGPFRSIAGAGYLLATNPRAWLLPGIVWAIAQVASVVSLRAAGIYADRFNASPPNYSLIEVVSLLVTVFTIIAAGWMGWQRPWLFGLAAAMAGTFIQALLLALTIQPTPGVGANAMTIFIGVTLDQILRLQWMLAAGIGWYGGYLRRRMVVTRPPPQRRSGRR